MALTDKLTAIADAIRSKTNGTAKLTLPQMADAINGLSCTGADASGKCWLVKDGEYINLAGKWSSNSAKGDGYIQQKFASGGTNYYACYDPIDLTNYTTLTVVVSKAYTGSTARTRQLWVSAYNSVTEPTNKASNTGINAAGTYTIDISSLTGYHMVRWRGQYDALQWTDMYLS